MAGRPVDALTVDLERADVHGAPAGNALPHGGGFQPQGHRIVREGIAKRLELAEIHAVGSICGLLRHLLSLLEMWWMSAG